VAAVRAAQNAVAGPGPMRGGPAGTLFRGPTATEGPETEGIFEYSLLTNSE